MFQPFRSQSKSFLTSILSVAGVLTVCGATLTMTATAAAQATATPVKPAQRPDGDRTASPAIRSATPPANVAQSINNAVAAESEAVRFDPPVLDLGELQAEVPKTMSVKVTNITDKPVKISRITTSCGCTTAKAPDAPIPPGEFVEIPITLKPGPRQGQTLSKRATFVIDDYPPAVLVVQGVVPEYVAVNPALLSADPANPDSGVVTLKAIDNVPFRIVNVLPPIVLDYTDEAKVEHVVHIDWSEWEKNGSSIRATFNTDHPKAPSLPVMIKRPLQRKPTDLADAANTHADQNATVDPNTAMLITAARQGNPERVAAAISKGGEVNGTDRTNGRSALHWAAKEGHLDAAKSLVKAGADVNLGDRTGKTPLTLAAESGKTDVVNFLLSEGAAVNSRDQIGGSPILWAAGLGNADTVKALVDAGADVQVQDVNGLTPLLWAAGIGDPKAVEVLIAAKADINATDLISGDDAFMRAVRSGKIESMKLLLQAGADINRKNKVGQTPLLIAASMSGGLDKIKFLIENNADLTVRDVRGMSVLDHANNRIDDQKEAVLAYLQSVMPEGSAAASGATSNSNAGSSN